MAQWEDCDLVHQSDFSLRPFASPCHVLHDGGVSPGVVGGERVVGGVSPPCSS